MGSLKKAAKKTMKGKAPKMVLDHPTEDSPDAPYRQVYNPPQAEDRFQFLKTFATIPGLRNKGSQQK
jgi:hypothetical protein